MSTNKFSRLSDGALLRELAALLAHDCGTTATLLACLAEVDARRLYVPAGYPSMYAFCVGQLHFSEDTACKRIRAARAARQFPAIFTAVAEGRVHLSGVVVLAPHLTPENVEELLAAATHKSRAEIDLLLAKRFPRPDLPQRVEAIPASLSLAAQLPPETAELSAPGRIMDLQSGQETIEPSAARRVEAPALTAQVTPGPVGSSAPARIEAPAPAPVERARVAPLSAERYALQVTISQSAYEKLRHAQALLGHQISPGEIAPVLERALDALIAQLEKRKFAATSRPRPQSRPKAAHPRYIPAAVKRAVWQRDGGQCTFVSESGRRCRERSALEFDHVDPVACGGEATVGRVRLRCRAHNQYAAERAFGSEFMSHKRHEAQRAGARASRS